MEMYARNIVYCCQTIWATDEVMKHPVMSFHNLTDALDWVNSHPTEIYEIIDVENITMGDMSKRFRVDNNHELEEIV